jgi:hypothetical protein
MKAYALAGVIALALSACSPAPATDEAAAPAGGASAKRVALPECDAVEAQDQGADGWKHPDCRALLPDGSGLAIEARYAPAEDESIEVTIQVVQTGDKTIQEFKERMGNTFNGPNVKDFDGDGKADVLLPLETGNVNTSWAVYRQVEGPKFVRVGEPSGVSLVKTESGYIAAQGRSSAADYYVSFFSLEPEELKPVLTVEVSGKGEPGKVTDVECVLTDDGGMAETGLTEDAAKAKFCAEPTVVGLIKDMMP